jgi:hypothetical protein
MEEFEDIRPYRDDEVSAAVARLATSRELIRAASDYVAPSLHRWCPPLVHARVRGELRRALRKVDTVADFQRLLAKAFEKMVAETANGFTVTGTAHIDPETRYLFVSNHRDIGLDSAFANYALHEAGHRTTHNAIGDNLLHTGFAADVFRLNKGFVVMRSAKGAKAAYAAMLKTSNYIRHSIESGESVWIAQREGRAKDGWDRTDPAIIKMFALAFRGETADLGQIVARLRILPMSISYELDPCDLLKARELETMARTSAYEKRAGEDFESVVTGIRGEKGRVQLNFAAPLTGEFADAAAVAAAIDRHIVAGFHLFPTHLWAAQESGLDALPAFATSAALDRLKARIAAAPPALRPYLLVQYANPVRRAREFGLI